jgi:hypothetical protein
VGGWQGVTVRGCLTRRCSRRAARGAQPVAQPISCGSRLVYVGRELHTNTAAAQAATYRQVIQNSDEYLLAIATDPSLAGIARRAHHPDSLNPRRGPSVLLSPAFFLAEHGERSRPAWKGSAGRRGLGDVPPLALRRRTPRSFMALPEAVPESRVCEGCRSVQRGLMPPPPADFRGPCLLTEVST